MKKLLSILCLTTVLATGFGIANISFADNTTKSQNVVVAQSAAISVSQDALIKNPSNYLNKKITMTSRFSKFSTLGLDYKPALRESDNYISFMFLRDDTANKIPQSELKMFITRKIAEKLPDLKEGDKIKVCGQVFSDALGDAWVDIENIELLK